MLQDLPPKSQSAVPPRRLGGLVKTSPLSSEESDGALSRSEAQLFSAPRFFACAPFLPRNIIDGFCSTGFKPVWFSEIYILTG